MRKYAILTETVDPDGLAKVVRVNPQAMSEEDMRDYVESMYPSILQMCRIIRDGDVDALDGFYTENHFMLFSYLGDDAKDRYVDNITATFICMNAAIEGGADKATAYVMRKEQIARLSETDTEADSMRFLAEIVRDYCHLSAEAKRKPDEPALVSRVNELIRNNPRRRVTAAFLSERLGMNAEYIMRRYRALSGRTVAQAVAAHRVSVAKRLLADGDLPMEELAERLGFASVSHLYTVFTRATGMPPRTYQQWALDHRARAQSDEEESK